MKLNKIINTAFLCSITAFFSTNILAGEIGASATSDAKSTVTSGTTEPTPLDLLSMDVTYTAASSVRQGPSLGKLSTTHSDFSYGHRFQVTGNWYLRLGVEYERFDFGRKISPLPDHLQAATADIAFEYVVQGFAGAAVEIHPGFYYENDINRRNFAVPVDVYSAFPIKKDHLYGMVGFYTSPFISPPVIPICGVIWLINDKWRAEALFPRPSLVYTANDDWEFRLVGDVGGGGFHVDENGRTPATHQGSDLQYEYYQAGFKATYSHMKPFDLTFGGGYSFEREFDYIHDGPYQKFKVVGAPYIQVALEAKF